MNNLIENNDDQFANGQVSCELRGNSDATESETQLDAVNVIEQRPDVASEEFPAPIGKLLGLMITSSGAGRATVEFEASGRYANPMGTLHGGVLCDLADAAMGVAYLSTLAEGETATTIELKIDFLRPVWKAMLRAEARVVRAGKSSASSNAIFSTNGSSSLRVAPAPVGRCADGSPRAGSYWRKQQLDCFVTS